ncbi:MAG: hypothetical protein QOG43_800 [Actinomycetota bacterium]|jgi:hypothetical protein|nr:hypothetical protein [Actinomycetota bacterium]
MTSDNHDEGRGGGYDQDHETDGRDADDVGEVGDAGPFPGDDDLLQELRTIVGRIDPTPPELVAAARSGFIWRTIDAELAQLTSDSVLDADRMAAVRGVAAPELLTFESAGLTVEVETAAGPDGVRLLGQLVPARAGSVEVRHGGGSVTVDVDDMGRFTAAGLEPGPVSLSCRTVVGGLRVDTDWFLVR